MKIAYRAGHNEQATGSNALINEVVEDRRVVAEMEKLLEKTNHSLLNCTPGRCNNRTDLAYGVNKANLWGADLFVSIHFNKAYEEYNGRLGTEVLVYNTGKSNPEAKRVMDKMSKLGFKFRGLKERPELYELKHTKMRSLIVEVCFCESTEDVKLYKELGYAKIAEAIVEGILGKDVIPSKPNTSKPTSSIKKGDIVKVKKSAKKYATGEKIADFVYENTYEIEQIKDSKALLSDIVSWVLVKDLEVVKGNSKPSNPDLSKYGTVIATSLNVRSGAGTNHKVIGTLKKGEKVKLGNKVGEWWAIYYSTNGGFVHSKYIKV